MEHLLHSLPHHCKQAPKKSIQIPTRRIAPWETQKWPIFKILQALWNISNMQFKINNSLFLKSLSYLWQHILNINRASLCFRESYRSEETQIWSALTKDFTLYIQRNQVSLPPFQFSYGAVLGTWGLIK